MSFKHITVRYPGLLRRMMFASSFVDVCLLTLRRSSLPERYMITTGTKESLVFIDLKWFMLMNFEACSEFQ